MPHTAPSNLPLAGVRVVDFSRLLPGPWCAQTLGDLGADVIKVEQPEIGDYSRFNPPNYKTVIEILEESIKACDAVIALVGFRFGSSPFTPVGEGRSYTQLEYDAAARLGKPIFLFLANPDFAPHQRV